MKPETFKKYVKFIDDLKDGKPRIELKGVASAFISYLVGNGFIERKVGGSYVWSKNKTQLDSNYIARSYVVIHVGEIEPIVMIPNEAKPKQSIKVLSITEREIIGYILHLEQISGCKYKLIKTETITKTTVIHE